LLDEESSTSFSLIVSTVCDHCKDVLSRIQEEGNCFIVSFLLPEIFWPSTCAKIPYSASIDSLGENGGCFVDERVAKRITNA
ncbi:hypothetical protein, partial [Geobacillus stearothermophilus]|uniref:hypothetical protein n=1 Tax=Geobacillus stearothermophilus TaxID=1422 RepID=UPI002E1DAE4A|nr:hypothetical protein [Geobacillus stearothermophilus]